MRECQAQKDCVPGYICMRSPIGITLCCTSNLPIYMQPWPGINGKICCNMCNRVCLSNFVVHLSVRYQQNPYNQGYYQPSVQYGTDPNFGIMAAQPIVQVITPAVATPPPTTIPPTTPILTTTLATVIASGSSSSARPPSIKPPTVQPLLIGKYVISSDPNLVSMSGSVTLVQDNGLNIIVDTGLPSYREQIIQGK